jgi:hypothetical protein
VTAGWALRKAILAEIGRDDGQTDEQLAERLSVPPADVRREARVLYRMRGLDFIWGYLVAVPPAGEGSRAA